MGFNCKFASDVTVIEDKVRGNLKEAADELREKSIEWIQEAMLYRYNDPHGPDGHTEIVDTGATFESIDAKVKRDSSNAYTVKAGAGTEYAVFVHNGTRKLKARPFIRDPMIDHINDIKGIVEDHAKEGM